MSMNCPQYSLKHIALAGAGTTPEQPRGSITDKQQTVYTSPQRWAAQQTFRRRPSKSPNIRDRTPIRHNRPVMSRHRSTSRSEALLAYAEGQSQQIQPDNVSAPSLGYGQSLSPPLQLYHSQQFVFTPTTSPYLNQQQYYETPTMPMTYNSLSIHQPVPSTPNIYSASRPQLQPVQVQGNSVISTDTYYTQQRPVQLPSSTSTPSNFPPISQPLESTPTEPEATGSRTKPQCWDHGCNGRQFSTFSNLLRHQREKSGTATKARCPHCGTEFTRTTARKGHMEGGKCKGMPGQNQGGGQDNEGIS